MVRRRKSGLNFGRRKKKINFAVVKEVLSWTVEIALTLLIAFTFVYFIGLRTSVVGVPGDTVQIKNGTVYVNGKAFDEETDVASIEDAGLAAEEITLGAEEYFVLGDNRNNSEDSRYANIGNIKKDYIIGKAWFRIAPFSEIGFL